MSQAQIAGGQLTAAGELPAKGYCIRTFSLFSTDGKPVSLSDYRGRRNLVLVFADDQPRTTQLLSQIAPRYQAFKDSEAEVLVIAPPSSQTVDRLQLPFPVLLDKDNRVHKQVGASSRQGQAEAAVYVTDRFAEVFALYRTSDGQVLPTVDDILNWLEFVNSQCPECEPPEWPL